MTQWIHVARWEFLTTIRKPAFIGVIIGLPVFCAAVSCLLAFSIQMAASLPGTPSPIGIVDRAGLVGTLVAEKGSPAAPLIHAYASLESCLSETRHEVVRACYAIGERYRATGELAAYRLAPRSLAGLGDPPSHGERIARLLRLALLREGGRSDATAEDRLVDPLAGVTEHLIGNGVEMVDGAFGTAMGLAGTMGLGLFLTFGIFFAAGFLQVAAARERQSRLHELLLSTISPRHLVTGKMLGLGAAGLLQTACYFALILLPAAWWLPAAGLTGAQLAGSAFYFLLGYALFSAVLITAGMIVRGETGSQEVATMLGLVTAVPLLLIAVVGAEPNGLLARTLSAFPLTAPVAMLVRLGLSPITWADHMIASASIVLMIALCIEAAVVLVRASVLMTGQRIDLPTLWRQLRRV